MSDSTVFFREKQRFTHIWLWILIAGLTLLQLWIALTEPLSRAERLLVGATGIAIPVFIASLSLRTEVREDGVHLQFFPLHLTERHVSFDDLTGFDAREYRPLAEYGGWGIRRGRNGWAYNVRGAEGVELRYRGKTLLVGTQRPNEFVEALNQARR